MVSLSLTVADVKIKIDYVLNDFTVDEELVMNTTPPVEPPPPPKQQIDLNDIEIVDEDVKVDIDLKFLFEPPKFEFVDGFEIEDNPFEVVDETFLHGAVQKNPVPKGGDAA
ncbi:MAG TPA: hypothetical protein ENN45_04195 [Bacteroidetes bacterium]|nr:hypothetical protein [Bacteroidota bacterium]